MANKKVLIVEDNPTLIKALKAKFEKSQFKVAYAMDGEEGIYAFEKENPDIIILDIAMPKKDGFEVLEHLRNTLKSEVPVIILSNSKDLSLVDRAKALNVHTYLLKADTSLVTLVENVVKLTS